MVLRLTSWKRGLLGFDMPLGTPQEETVWLCFAIDFAYWLLGKYRTVQDIYHPFYIFLLANVSGSLVVDAGEE